MEEDIQKSETPTPVESPVEIPLEFFRKPEFKLHFCNAIQIAPGNRKELQIFFGQIIAPPSNAPKPEKLSCEQFFGVAITLDHSKRLYDLLGRQIKAAEIAAEKKAEKKTPKPE
jgi:hypothetical protein